MTRGRVVDWLLEEDNPPVRLLALTRLLGRPETDQAVIAAHSARMDYSVTRTILAHAEESWGGGIDAYQKYKGKYWQTIFLGMLLADGHDPRLARGLHDLLEGRSWVNRWRGGQCLTANMLTAFRRLGYGDHPVVVEETEALARRLLADGGIDCEVMIYSPLSRCYMALPKLLLCLSEIPVQRRSAAQQAAIDWMVQTLVEHHVYRYVPGNRRDWHEAVLARAPKAADLPPGYRTVKGWVAEHSARYVAEHGLGKRLPKRGWTRFGFPQNYNSDVLEAMVALATADVPMSAGLEDPLRVIRDKRNADGTWHLETTLNGKMWADVEVKSQPSKWLTLFALLVLDHFE